MNIKKTILVIFCFWILPQIVLSQITYGKITYERKTNLYKKFKHNSDVKEWLK